MVLPGAEGTSDVRRFSGVRRLWLRLFAVLGVVFLVSACSGPARDRVVLRTGSGEHVFTVELAETPESRARGLMFRQSLDADRGMLFDFKQERDVSFWMQNTFIPLDMIFIAADGTVKKIHANARPLDQTSISSGEPVRFVLEIPGGRAAEIGLEPGDVMQHPLVEN